MSELVDNRSLSTRGIRPEWIRLPKSGTRCPYSGLSRSAMNGLILDKEPKVKSTVLKTKGASRGVRLVNYESLMNHIDQCSSE